MLALETFGFDVPSTVQLEEELSLMINHFNDHAANERTFLAWVRSAMALVGFGLVIAHLRDSDVGTESQIALIAMGSLVVLIAYARMHLLMHRIEDPAACSYSVGRHRMLFVGSILSFLALAVMFLWNIV